MPLTVPGKPTVTDCPAAPAAATWLQTEVVITEFDSVPTSDQPGGPVSADVATPVATSSMPSPVVTVLGTVTFSVAALPRPCPPTRRS